MGYRRKGRELALQGLYQSEITGEDSLPAMHAFLRHFNVEDEASEFAFSIVNGMLERAAAIDDLIREACDNWRFERLSKIDLNILRVATYELLATPEVPVSVVINEAIEIARRFGTQESAVFVNGVIDAIAERTGAKAREAHSSNENG